jgi:hypothetical protein
MNNLNNNYQDNYQYGYKENEMAKGFFSSTRLFGSKDRIHLLKNYKTAGSDSRLLDQFAIAAEKIKQFKSEEEKNEAVEKFKKSKKTILITDDEGNPCYKINRESLKSRLHLIDKQLISLYDEIENNGGSITKTEFDKFAKDLLKSAISYEVNDHVNKLKNFSSYVHNRPSYDRDKIADYFNNKIPLNQVGAVFEKLSKENLVDLTSIIESNEKIDPKIYIEIARFYEKATPSLSLEENLKAIEFYKKADSQHCAHIEQSKTKLQQNKTKSDQKPTIDYSTSLILGDYYFQMGKNTKKDSNFKMALYHYKLAAENKGDDESRAVAQVKLAKIYKNGIPTINLVADPDKSHEYAQAAEKYYTEAINKVNGFSDSHHQIKQDEKLGEQLLYLGELNELWNTDLEQDAGGSEYISAAKRGNIEARLKLGDLYYKLNDLPEALKSYKAFLDGNHSLSTLEKCDIYLKMANISLVQNEKENAKEYALAVTQEWDLKTGSLGEKAKEQAKEAHLMLGNLFEDTMEKKLHYEAAISLGSIEGFLKLGDAYLSYAKNAKDETTKNNLTLYALRKYDEFIEVGGLDSMSEKKIGELYFQMGKIYSEMNNEFLAQSYYEKAAACKYLNAQILIGDHGARKAIESAQQNASFALAIADNAAQNYKAAILNINDEKVIGKIHLKIGNMYKALEDNENIKKAIQNKEIQSFERKTITNYTRASTLGIPEANLKLGRYHEEKASQAEERVKELFIDGKPVDPRKFARIELNLALEAYKKALEFGEKEAQQLLAHAEETLKNLEASNNDRSPNM